MPKPTNITFFSINMKNVLQWNPPEGLHGIELTYTVQYFIYGQKKWLSKSECRQINRTYCDLSAETSDYEHQYYAKVKAIWEANCSEWAETERFYPLLETQIGPPEVALAASEKSISIVLTAPEKWKRNPEDPTVSMQQIYSSLNYNISVYNTKSKRMWSQFVTNHTLVLSWLEPNTLYCVTVESFVPGLPGHTQPSQQCVSTLQDQTSTLKVKIIFWYVLPISVVLFLFSGIGCSIYRYIHVGKEKHPENLILLYGSELDQRFFAPAEQTVVNFITLTIRDDSRIPPKETVESVHAGAPLRAPARSWGRAPRLEDAWVQPSGYAAHVVEVEESGQGAALTPEAGPGAATPTEKAAPALQYHVRAELPRGLAGHPPGAREQGPRPGALPVQQALLCGYTPRLCDVAREHTVPEEGGEEPPRTLVDWDPRTGRLRISSLCSSDPEPEDRAPGDGDGLPEQSLLSRLYEKQAPDQPAEGCGDCLVEFMEEWGLYVQMGS
ncbi:interleukin-20 receptor subunit alpha isoform X1 [Dipodomys spectabilis]|uniref:interleukin-20 receptor subunit alpha isoform X1 n=1 Tax=Dipodomys spectabilis TaxID=105255 RepID=UPI001C534501|nr:interleukin-20 receptor subunit alpha isoform X1 [Dipodomys spectabilis]